MSAGPQPGRRRAERGALSLGWRLGAALGLVVVAGAVTLLVVALLVAPQIFQAHLDMVLSDPIEPAVQTHVNEAFATAILLSLAVAVPVALITAFAVTWVVTRRLTHTVRSVAAAADHLATGDLGVRVEEPAIGAEFAQLASAFNTMADRLAEAETTRRRLIGDLAHELRTPLAALEATVDAVTDGVLPADDTTLATLHDQTDRLGRLVTDMAAVSRAEERVLALHPQRVDLAEIAAHGVAAHQQRYAAAGRQLILTAPTPSLQVRVDPLRLGEALGNLLDNALEHSPSGAAVRVVVRGAGRRAVLDVIDAGSGLPPGGAERIFERFYRADASRTGNGTHSGVGLTIARAIVEAHDGTLTAANNDTGPGATFTVSLPTTTAAPSD